jgi:hypothetical protein
LKFSLKLDGVTHGHLEDFNFLKFLSFSLFFFKTEKAVPRGGAERGVDEGEFIRNVEWNPKRKV